MRRDVGDTRLVTEPEPTPVFRRFPYVQLVFCVACLSMAAWTWMRYSYAWDVTPGHLSESRLPGAYTRGEWPYGHRYVRLMGVLSIQRKVVSLHRPLQFATLRLSNGQEVLAHLKKQGTPDDETRREVTGRLLTGVRNDKGRISGALPYLVADGRLTGASGAGIVVGAMGCFIFGLYLRGWLRERKALASQPRQDMIA
jgi:hypothetical protein